jgi:NAD(P)-dependent dehydrogenase (short-subunit alcohol dehydrogenase family)
MAKNNPLFDLSGRTALVTGSSQGIGLALARGLAEAGAAVVLNGRDAAKLDAAAVGLRAAVPGARVTTAAFDVTNSVAIETAVARLEAEFAPIDVLFNNAGIHRRSPLAEMSEAQWREVLDTNLTSTFLVARAVAPRMIARGAGKIINTCSVMSEVSRPTCFGCDWSTLSMVLRPNGAASRTSSGSSSVPSVPGPESASATRLVAKEEKHPEQTSASAAGKAKRNMCTPSMETPAHKEHHAEGQRPSSSRACYEPLPSQGAR